MGMAIASTISMRAAPYSIVPEAHGVPLTSLWEDAPASFDAWRNHGTPRFASCARVSRRPTRKGYRILESNVGEVDEEAVVLRLLVAALELKRPEADDECRSALSCCAAMG